MRDRRSRFLVTALAALAMLLSACGSGGAGDGAQGGSGETRVVTDDLGTRVTVPVTPRRVVTTHFLVTMSTLDLGLPPVGTAVWTPPVVTEAYATTLANVPVVTSQTAEPDLEQIAAQSPDLILATTFSNEQVLGRLRQIAPTFVLRVSEGGANTASWPDRNRKIADVLGRTGEYDRLAADFEARKQRIKQTYAQRINGRTVAIVTGFQENNASVFGGTSGAGQILTDLGFRYSPQAQAASNGGRGGIASVSFERIGSVVGDADTVFLGSDLRGRVSSFVTSLQQTRLYQDLPAVRANRIGQLKPQVTGYTDANFALDQIEKLLQTVRS